jgi:hypothetical protein
LKLVRRWARLRSLDRAQWRVLLASLLLVPAVQLSLRLVGFKRTAKWLARRSDGAAVAAQVPESRAAAEAVGLIAGRPVVGARCLGRSLVLWFLLRRRGIDAELLIGAETQRRGALSAHAWVEVAGDPVNDVSDVRERFGNLGVSLPRLS